MYSYSSSKVILFAHLIPCCQNFIKEDTNVVHFEEEMNRRSSSLSNKKRNKLVKYLVCHPCNRINPALEHHITSKFGNLFTPHYLRGKQTIQQISWERILSLIRNILCHEYSPNWICLEELSKYIIDYFEGLESFSDFIRLYYEIVLEKSIYQASK